MKLFHYSNWLIELTKSLEPIMLPITALEFKQISQLLHQQCGIHLNADQDYLLETRLSDFMRQAGISGFSDLIIRIQQQPDKFLPTIINLMTTNETLWFRDESCWNALKKKILPDLLKQIKNKTDSIRVWVAGCSTGQEAYSLAILIDEICQQYNKIDWVRQFQIEAMDISENALSTARTGRYNNFEINRGLSVSRRERYFEQQSDGSWLLRPSIRLRVNFNTVNLTKDFSHLGTFDLILCRNVTIYFTPEMRKQVLSNMVNMLKPKGALLIGATESLWELRDRVNTVEFEACLFVRA